MLVPVQAELGRAQALGQVLEAPGQARVWGWAEHPARQRSVKPDGTVRRPVFVTIAICLMLREIVRAIDCLQTRS